MPFAGVGGVRSTEFHRDINTFWLVVPQHSLSFGLIGFLTQLHIHPFILLNTWFTLDSEREKRGAKKHFSSYKWNSWSPRKSVCVCVCVCVCMCARARALSSNSLWPIKYHIINYKIKQAHIKSQHVEFNRHANIKNFYLGWFLYSKV